MNDRQTPLRPTTTSTPMSSSTAPFMAMFTAVAAITSRTRAGIALAAAVALLPGCDAGDDGSRELSPLQRAADEDDGKDDGAPEKLEDAASDAEPTLAQAPYRELVDAKLAGGKFQTTLTMTEHDPERPVTVWMLASEEDAQMQAFADEELIAQAKFVGAALDDEGDKRFAYRLELNPALADKLELAAQLSPAAHYWMLMMCDEMVENRNDAGPGSLREAVASVRNGGSVCFDPIEFASYAGDVNLSGEITVGKDVHICGTGPGASRVTTGGSDRIFQFGIGTEASLIDLTLHDGAADEGGLVYTRGELELRGASLHSGSAQRGGALFSDEGFLWIVDSSISSNTAEQGGGLYNDDGDGHIFETNVTSNQAEEGGGIFGNRATLKLREGALVMNNYADRGGGLFIEDYGISGYHYMWGGSIASNSAQQGGGVHMTDGFLEVHHDPMGAGMPTAIHANLAIDGGGVYVAQWGTVDVGIAGTVFQNGAQQDGGGIYSHGLIDMRHGGEVAQNAAGRDGGGIFNLGELDLFDAARIGDNSTHRSGGGVYNRSTGSVITWDGAVRIEDNTAVTGGGSGAGGGVANESGGTVIALPGTVTGNSPGNVVNLP